MTRTQFSDLLNIYYSVVSLLAMQPVLRERAVDLLAYRPPNWQDRSVALRSDWECWEHYLADELRRLGDWLDEAGGQLGTPGVQRPLAVPDWGGDG